MSDVIPSNGRCCSGGAALASRNSDRSSGGGGASPTVDQRYNGKKSDCICFMCVPWSKTCKRARLEQAYHEPANPAIFYGILHGAANSVKSRIFVLLQDILVRLPNNLFIVI